jgi:hypothetical protein
MADAFAVTSLLTCIVEHSYTFEIFAYSSASLAKTYNHGARSHKKKPWTEKQKLYHEPHSTV